ncbi:MAG: NAD(P)-binding domain-containing protein [Bryobacteraceae bacterium]|nr:NAD(P)-binding domain-containing protein [Bryobacteraceae bacterium]
MGLSGKRYASLGGGIIAGVFIERLIQGAGVPPGNILATDIRPERLEQLAKQYGIRTSAANGEGAAFGEVMFLAVPPNAVKPVLAEVRGQLRPGALLVSLAAAVPTAAIEEAVGRPVPVVRVIPNTPSWIGRGMNPYCLGRHVSEADLPFVGQLLAVFGETVRLEEGLMNAATALTAVGPTYVFPVIQAMAAAAAGLGLPEPVALRAAAQTVLGAAWLVLETGKTPGELKEMISTRTLPEPEAERLFAGAIEAAYAKISAAEKKLVG